MAFEWEPCTQRHKHSKSKHPSIPTGNTYMGPEKQSHSKPIQNNKHFSPDPVEYSTQLALQIDNITLLSTSTAHTINT